MTHEAGQCPFCQEPLQPGEPPRCAFAGEPTCPLVPEAGPLPPDSRMMETQVAGVRDFDLIERTQAGSGAEIEAEAEAEAEADAETGFELGDGLAGHLLGQYQLGSILGRGSMGRVYRGEHLGLRRLCAIKVMDPVLVARHPQVLDRFWAEARAMAGLVHPHVVTVHNLGSDKGYHYIEMEFVPGGVSLRETLIREGPMDPARAATLVHQVVLGLTAAHRANLVHGDVKPSNVLLTAGGLAKLADFGLVRRLDAEPGGAAISGTPAFMAPELFAGAPASPRSDLYAVGVMFFYLLTARLPFVADRVSQLIRLHRSRPIPDVRDLVPAVPAEVAALVSRCLAKGPSDRPDSAEHLAEDLQAALLFGLRDAGGLVRESLAGIDCLVQGGPDHFRVLLRVPGGRLQEVHVEIGPDRLGQRLVSVYSVCGPADPAHFAFALKLNAELTYGGLSVREVDGRPMFVMSRAYPGGRAQPDEIRAAIQEIARRSDWVEQQLTQADVY